jgi:hypothetical protein
MREQAPAEMPVGSALRSNGMLAAEAQVGDCPTALNPPTGSVVGILSFLQNIKEFFTLIF